jgi:Asp-tRNA(Asn)/Glu-tRNA(Gln) amidotransferase A subunit family amidase
MPVAVVLACTSTGGLPIGIQIVATSCKEDICLVVSCKVFKRSNRPHEECSIKRKDIKEFSS